MKGGSLSGPPFMKLNDLPVSHEPEMSASLKT